jgi:hypothetical protein
MLIRHYEERQEFLASCKATPIKAIQGNSPADIRDREFRKRRRKRLDYRQ